MKNLLSLILACCLLTQISHVSAAANLRGSNGNSSTVTDQVVSAEAPSVVETLSNLGQRLLAKLLRKQRLKRQENTHKKHVKRHKRDVKLREARRRKTKKKKAFKEGLFG